jgi:hypothetical protein
MNPTFSGGRVMLDLLMNLVTIAYYLLVAYVAVVLVYCLLKSKSWEKEVLYIVVLIPFLLRLFGLK